jgi:hypothetical protein
MAVASAIRILGQREAAFPIHEISRTALDLGISGVTIEAVEARVRALADKGQLLYGTSGRSDGTVTHVTTPELLLEERRLLEGIDAGRGAVAPVLSAGDAATRLAGHSTDRPLSGEQLDAGILALSSNDRVVVIQGVAGAGKTTLISAIADAARHESRQCWDWPSQHHGRNAEDRRRDRGANSLLFREPASESRTCRAR